MCEGSLKRENLILKCQPKEKDLDLSSALISIIIPTFNHGNYLRRALQSVLCQTYKNWEVIVIDNHSIDNTDEIIESFSDPRISYLKIHNNGVIAASRNLGIRNAKGQWIAFLDSDDWWKNNKLQLCFDSMETNVDLIHHDLVTIKNNSSKSVKMKVNIFQVSPPILINLLLKGNHIQQSSVVVRKSLLEKIGFINESPEMVACEDYNTWLRIAQITDQFKFIKIKLGYYSEHENSTSNKDMSIPARFAVAEFLHSLNDNQLNLIEANFQYIHSQYNYHSGNYIEAKNCLKFVFRYASIINKLKALWILLSIKLRLLC